MVRGIGLLVLIALAAPYASAQGGLEFSTPAQTGGDFAGGNATWIFIVGKADPSGVGLAGQASQVIEHIAVGPEAWNEGSPYHYAPSLPGIRREAPDGSDGWNFPEGAQGIYLEARDVIWHSGEAIIDVVGRHEAECGVTVFSPATMSRDEVRWRVGHDWPYGCGLLQPVFYFNSESTTIGMHIEARGVTRMDAYGLTHKDMSEDCKNLPEASAGAQGKRARLAFHCFLEVGMEEGSFSADIDAELFAVGGQGAVISTDGWGRFPKASAPVCAKSDCAIDGEGTLGIQGRFTLSGFAVHDDDRLSAQLDGTDLQARLDETPIELTLSTAATATAAAVGLGLLLKFVAAPLITRVGRKEALMHPRRKTIMEYVQKNPGTTLREVTQATRLASGTARHHLGILKRSGHLAEHRHGSTLRYFENHGAFDATWSAHVLLRRPDLAHLHTWLLEGGPAIQRDILDHAETWNWSRSTTQHRLQRLVQGGLVKVQASGRRKVYQALDPEQAHQRFTGHETFDRGMSIPVRPTD